MPQVPYTGAPSIGAENNPAPSRQLDVPIQAFGAGTAQAAQNLGRVAAGAGDEIYGRALAMQQLAETASANAAVADYTMQMGELYAQYRSYEGKKAVDEYQPFIESINQLRDKVKGSLGSEFAQKAYDSETRMMFSRTVFSAAAHAGDENKKYVIGTAYSRNKADANYALQFPEDEESATKARQTIKATAELDGAQHGQGPDWVKNKELELNSDFTAKQVSGMLNRDPMKAQKLLAEAKKNGLVDGGTFETLQNQIDTRIQTKFAAAEGSKIFNAAENKDASYEELREKAEKEAEKQFPGNKVYSDRLVQQVQQLKARKETAQRQDEYSRMTIMQGDLYGVGAKDGKLPTSINDFSPAGKAAYENSNPRTQAAVQRRLQANIRGDYAPTPENQQEYYRLRGALTDPYASVKEREAAIETDMNDLKLPAPQVRELMKLRNDLYMKTTNQSLLPKGMSLMQDTLSSADVGISKSRNPQAYSAYVGAFGEALRDAAAEKKAPLTNEEIRKIGLGLIDKVKIPGRLWGEREVREFEVEAPENVLESMRQNYRALGQVPPDDSVLQSMYSAARLKFKSNQFQSIFGK